MSSSTRVTAVLPCHNHAKWVTDAIDSVVQQTRRPDNIIIVNNGSKDNSKEVILNKFSDGVRHIKYDTCEQYQGQIDGIEAVLFNTDKGLGPSKARNLAVDAMLSDTDIFALLDTDDFYHPTKIEKSLKIIEEDPHNVGMVYSDYQTYNPDTNIYIREYKEPFSRARILQECLPNSDSLITAKVFQTVGLFDESYRVCEDFHLWQRIAERFMIVHIPENLVTIRVGNHSTTAQVDKSVWEDSWRRMYEDLRRRNAPR